MASKVPDLSNPETWSPETQLVHGGVLRSQFAETSEALFLTQGYVYKNAEEAEARFKGESPGYQYTRFGNPTVSMFEDRMKLLEGAEDARSTATGMAAVTAALLCYLKTGDHIVAARAMFGSCRYIIETLVPALRHRDDLDRRPRSGRLEERGQIQHENVLLRDAGQPDAGTRRYRRRVEDCARARHSRRCRQRVRHAAAAEAAAARRRHRHLFGDQAHRRPGPLPRRHRAVLDKVRHRSSAGLGAPDGAVAVAVQCLGAAQGPGDDARACRAPVRYGRGDVRAPGRQAGRQARASIPAAPITRRPRWPKSR